MCVVRDDGFEACIWRPESPAINTADRFWKVWPDSSKDLFVTASLPCQMPLTRWFVINLRYFSPLTLTTYQGNFDRILPSSTTRFTALTNFKFQTYKLYNYNINRISNSLADPTKRPTPSDLLQKPMLMKHVIQLHLEIGCLPCNGQYSTMGTLLVALLFSMTLLKPNIFSHLAFVANF